MSVPDRWPVAMRILEKLSELEAGRREPDLQGVIHVLAIDGEDRHELVRQGRALYKDGYIAGMPQTSAKGEFSLYKVHLAPKGMRKVGEWPSDDPYEELVRVLEAALEQTEDAETRTRLERLRDGLVGVGREVAVSLLTTFASRMA